MVDGVARAGVARVLLWLLMLLSAGALAQQESPARVGRVASVNGEVRLFDDDTREWVPVQRNRPIAQGARLVVGPGAAAELQVGATALVLGAEDSGLRRLQRENCDELVRLPISPAMESLNVSAAATVALYEIARAKPPVTEP